jgi:protein-disulfide isomerase
MKKALKPVIVIIILVGVAAGAAVYFSRAAEKPAESASIPTNVELKGGGHFRGPENAQVTLVEFGDYQCPTCGYYHPFVKEILNRYPDKLRLEFHHFPLAGQHRNAVLAAMAAEAAGDQGHYWEMHDALYQSQRAWSEAPNAEQYMIVLAGQVGLDVNKFMQGLRSPAVQDRIAQDVARASQLQLNETPTFMIDGKRVYIKPSTEDFVQVIEAHLNK